MMVFKALGGLAKGLTKESGWLANGEILPVTLNKKGMTALIGVGGVVSGISAYNTGLKAHNNTKLGRVMYEQGTDRMTQAFGTNAVPAIKKISQGNPEIERALIKDTLLHDFRYEDYGVDDKFISAFYGMGGY